MHLSAATLTSHITYTLADNHPSSPIPPTESPTVPLRTRTPHDQSSLRYGVEDILQIVLKNRKNWKTLKGRSEAVWPPYLEATMLKALQEYEPDDSRETRMLGRYPMRNRFISDYIHSTTGKYRSAKQVGSRLQQLRDTPEGRELIDMLTRCYRTRMNAGTCNARQLTTLDSPSSPPVSTISCDHSSSSSSSGSSTTPASPVTPPSPAMRPFLSSKARQPDEPRMPVYIDILPQQSQSSSTGSSSSTFGLSMSNSDSCPLGAARHIHNIDPTVTFVSPSRVNGKSSYIVLLEGAPVHSEDTTLEYVGPYFTSTTGRPSGDGPVLYNTPLVPKYWDVLCRAADPTLYTIIQEVFHVPNPIPDQGHGQRSGSARIFTATYHFQYYTSGDSYEQPVVEMSKGNSSVTSAFGEQTLQGSVMGLAPTAPFPVPTVHAIPTSEGLRTTGEVDQNLFDEPFMLDVNFEEMAFDDFVASMDNSNAFFM